MADVQAKRDAAIAKKEKERSEKNAAIAAEKKAKAAERGKEKSAKEKAEEAKQAKQAELNEKRAANIAAKEEERKSRAADVAANKGKGKGNSSKYSKKDVFELKAVFDEYDKSGDGKVSLEEFTSSLRQKKSASAPRAGEKSTLAQRQAQEGTSILDLSESVFHEMDADGDGEVSFGELLKLMFKFARPDEIETMLSWVAPPPEPEPEPKPELSKDAKDTIMGIFKLYDKDKSGTLTVGELKKALEKTGLDPDEVKQYFKDYDADDNGEIDKKEFMALMESTGAFDDM